jgi:hypothetical protein
MQWQHALALAALVGVQAASAVEVVGDVAPLEGVSAGPAGTVVEDTLMLYSYDIGYFNSTATQTISGTVESKVVHAADGTYDFYWRLLGADYFHFTVQGFLQQGLQANWLNDGTPGTQADLVYAPLPGPGFSNYVSFGFGPQFSGAYDPEDLRQWFWNEPSDAGGPGVMSGDTSWFFLDTQATSYGLATASVDVRIRDAYLIDPTQVGIQTFGPGVSPVPEPASAGLLLLGLSALGRRRRVRRG